MKKQLLFIHSSHVLFGLQREVILLDVYLKQNHLPFNVYFLGVKMKALESQHRTLSLHTSLQLFVVVVCHHSMNGNPNK
jgi:hypothetical protein